MEDSLFRRRARSAHARARRGVRDPGLRHRRQLQPSSSSSSSPSTAGAAVWGRSALTDRQRSLNNLCILAALNRSRGVQDPLPRRAAQRLHARRAARHADPDHGLRRRAGRRRGLPARPRRCSTPKASHRSRRRDIDSAAGGASASSGSATWAGRWPRDIAAAGSEVVCFDAAGTRRAPARRARSRRRAIADVAARCRHGACSACPTARRRWPSPTPIAAARRAARRRP